jgi:hypothetical protein
MTAAAADRRIAAATGTAPGAPPAVAPGPLALRFAEPMAGAVTLFGERFTRPFRFDLDARGLSPAAIVGTATLACRGTVRIDGVASDTDAVGTMSVSPFRRRRIGYDLTFGTDDGARMRFCGHKTINWLRPGRSWTTLPGELSDADTGAVLGTATVYFDLRRDLVPFLARVRPDGRSGR